MTDAFNLAYNSCAECNKTEYKVNPPPTFDWATPAETTNPYDGLLAGLNTTGNWVYENRTELAIGAGLIGVSMVPGGIYVVGTLGAYQGSQGLATNLGLMHGQTPNEQGAYTIINPDGTTSMVHKDELRWKMGGNSALIGASILPMMPKGGVSKLAKTQPRTVKTDFPTLKKNPTKGVPKGARILGKNPGYIDFAKETGGKRFNIPDKIWNAMSDDAKWAANQKFLDRGVAKGEPFALSHEVKDISKINGYFRKELEYLQSKGYILNEAGTMMIKGL